MSDPSRAPPTTPARSPRSESTVGEERRAARLGGGGRVTGEGGSAEERLQAAGAAAGAGRPVVLDLDVPDVAGAATDTAVHAAAEEQPAADPRTDLDEQEVLGPA